MFWKHPIPEVCSLDQKREYYLGICRNCKTLSLSILSGSEALRSMSQHLNKSFRWLWSHREFDIIVMKEAVAQWNSESVSQDYKVRMGDTGQRRQTQAALTASLLNLTEWMMNIYYHLCMIPSVFTMLSQPVPRKWSLLYSLVYS